MSDGVEDTYTASPQQQGRSVHVSIDKPREDGKSLKGINVMSDKLRLYGKIDIYNIDEKTLIERKRNVKNMYRGFYYQIWAQYFCMTEMGYEVNKLFIESYINQELIQVDIPGEQEYRELFEHIRKIAQYNPLTDAITLNENKCTHCIYSSICDKTTLENVYS